MDSTLKRTGTLCNSNMVRQQALQFARNVEFRASNGWMCNFLERKNLVRRRVTTSGRELPRDAAKLTSEFIQKAATKYCRPNFQRKSLVNMDETSIYLDDSSKVSFS